MIDSLEEHNRIIPDDLAKRMNVSSMVLSTAHSVPGMRDLATAMAPCSSRCLELGCVVPMLVRNTSNHARYLPREKELNYNQAIRVVLTGKYTIQKIQCMKE